MAAYYYTVSYDTPSGNIIFCYDTYAEAIDAWLEPARVFRNVELTRRSEGRYADPLLMRSTNVPADLWKYPAYSEN